ncbi:hypothetical protein LBMAG27_10310 [Bacteroidota bacterium]|nr:hypothetical protein LBMAG27_10310 [Bacteroidota bacterium]
MSNDEVQIQYKKLSTQPTDQLKLNYLNTWLRGRCLLSNHAYQLAAVFYDDGMRLQFAYSAYPNIYDKENYYLLFDAFNSLSFAFRFYDFVNGNTVEYQAPPPPSPVKIFPDLNYPSPVGYKGVGGCSLPMSDNDFMVLVTPVVQQQGDVNRMNTGTQFIQNNCVSLAQLIMLSTLIQLDMNRMKFLKQNITRCYDIQNFSFADQLFSTQAYKVDWIAFGDATVKSLLPPPIPVVPICVVTDADMNSIISTIKNLSFSSTKISTAKQIIQSKKCFTVSQMKAIVLLMDFEADKLEVAKYGYDYTIDQQNYYQMTDVFDFDSSSNDLLAFLKTKK